MYTTIKTSSIEETKQVIESYLESGAWVINIITFDNSVYITFGTPQASVSPVS